jgi:hypothetical protein
MKKPTSKPTKPTKPTVLRGLLEIDHARGVVYFHASSTGHTVLRICRLGRIPRPVSQIDVTHLVGVGFYPQDLL